MSLRIIVAIPTTNYEQYLTHEKIAVTQRDFLKCHKISLVESKKGFPMSEFRYGIFPSSLSFP